MKCPHCLVEFFPQFSENAIAYDIDGKWFYCATVCPACKKVIIDLKLCEPNLNAQPLNNPDWVKKTIRAYPKGSARPPCPIEVDNQYKQDYEEACLVLQDSPKASAALSRRCLQLILREKVGVKKSDLSREIDEAIQQEHYPSHISRLLHALRQVGNFSAHPQKSTTTGAIIDVEPDEAELCLEVIEALFDYHFVLPAKHKSRLELLNQKFTDAGKPPV